MTITPERAISDPTATAPRVSFPDTVAFRGFFEPVRIEADVHDLEVEGRIPPDLAGVFFRAAADAQYPPSHKNDIYINGDGMITDGPHRRTATPTCAPASCAPSGSSVSARRASSLFGAYRNPFTDDPSVAGIDDGNANTSVVWHGGKLLALKEAARPLRARPRSRSRPSGIYDFGGQS